MAIEQHKTPPGGHAEFLLSLAMALSMMTWGASAANYEDMPADWSKGAMEAAVTNGMLRGDDLGRLDPGGPLTCAQMAAVIVRALGATAKDDLSSYRDMNPEQWYYGDVAQAVHMSILFGDSGAMFPTRNITRQEAFTVLARALKLADGDPAASERFHDSDRVADWAVGSIAAMVTADYVNGSNGALNPLGSITREESLPRSCTTSSNTIIPSPGPTPKHSPDLSL